MCPYRKYFYEKSFSKEANRILSIRPIKAKTFNETAEATATSSTSSTTVIRRFKKMVLKEIENGIQLQKPIAIDENKGDTDIGKHH